MTCGYIHNGEEPPEECPACKAPKSMFVEIDEQGNKIAPSSNQPSPPPQAEIPPPAPRSKIENFVLHNHLHPILVHTPNGLIPVVVLFLLLNNIFHLQSFEKASYYNLIFVLMAIIPVIATGYTEWKVRYKRAKTVLFLTKIICGLIVFVSLVILAGWRLINPEVSSPASPTKWVYFLIGLIMLVAVGIAGHLGGKLVFGSRDT